MSIQTLEQLKEENAKAEEAAKTLADEQAAKLEAGADEQADLDAKAEGDADDSESDSDDWLAEPKEGEGEGQKVPLKALINTREKLKGKLADKDSELDKLRAEVESLKQAKATPPAAVRASVSQEEVVEKLPNPSDYGTDEQYQAAMQRYIAGQVKQHISLVKQTDDASQRQAAQVKAIEDAVDAHYKRAADFLGKSNVSEERYRKADLTVRQAVDSVFSGKGDVITDAIIAKAGEGTEVAMMYLGVNEEARAVFVNKLITDPTGLSAIAYMARLAEQKSKARLNSSSGAPAPAARVRGGNGGGPKVDGEALKKIYKAETKNGGYSQAAFDAKQRAKAAGVDTSTW